MIAPSLGEASTASLGHGENLVENYIDVPEDDADERDSLFLRGIGSGHMLNEKTIFYRCRRRYLHNDPNAHSFEPPIDFMTRFQSRKLFLNKDASEEVANSKSVKDINWATHGTQETNENINDTNENVASPHLNSPSNSPLKSRSSSHSRKYRKSTRKGRDYWGNYKRIEPDAYRYDDPKNWDLQKKHGIKYLENKITGAIRPTKVYETLMEEDHRVATGQPVYDGKELWELLDILERNDEIQAKKTKEEGTRVK